MEFKKTNLNDCYEIIPDRFGDERGYFSPYFIKEQLINIELDNVFKEVVQANRSMSSKGTIRGLHYQLYPFSQAKIVEVINGKAIDVAVDLRTDSSTFGDYTYAILDSKKGNQLLIPRGFAHGFVALEDNTIFQYLVDNVYAPKFEDGIAWNDPLLKINWQEWFNKYGIEKPLLSEKDLKHDTLSEKIKKKEIKFKRGF